MAVGSIRLSVGLLRVLLRWLLLLNLALGLLWLVVIWLWLRLAVDLFSWDLQVLRFVLRRLSLRGLRVLVWRASDVYALPKLGNLSLEAVEILFQAPGVGFSLLKLPLQILDLLVFACEFIGEALNFLLLWPSQRLGEVQLSLQSLDDLLQRCDLLHRSILGGGPGREHCEDGVVGR